MITYICILLVHLYKVNAQFSDVGAQACSQIIKAGIYNTFQSSSATTSYSAFQSTMCSDLSGYTYDVYSQQIASKQGNSQALGVNAAASYFDIGGSVGVDTSSSSLSESQFNQFKLTQSAYRQTTCASSSSTSDFGNSVGTISNIIDPTVSTSYTNCLKVYATGIQITQNTGVNTRSLSIDIQFVTNNLGAAAYMTGLQVTGPALCTLQGPNLPTGATSTFQFQLTVGAVYSIVCTIPDSTPADGGITDVYLSTTPGGTYHALLFHSVPVDQLAILQSQFATLNSHASLLASKPDYTTIGPAFYTSDAIRTYPGAYTNVAMTWPSGNFYFGDSSIFSYTVPYGGSVVGISASTDADNPDNNAVYSIKVFLNDEALLQSTDFPVLVMSAPQPSNVAYNNFDVGTYNFLQGDIISIYIALSNSPIYVNSFAWLTLAYKTV